MAITRVVWTDDSGGGTDGTILNNANLVTIYDSIELTWAWTSVTHSDANFKGDNVDANWVVASGDQSTFKYMRIGKHLTISLTLINTTVANTPGTLQVTIPGSFTAAVAAGGSFWYDENGTSGLGRWFVSAAGTTLSLTKTSGTFSNQTDQTDVQVTAVFEIQ